jgi:phosphonate transport system substrate-binding protein
MKKHPLLATLSGLVLCLILVGFIGSSSTIDQEDQADAITMVLIPSEDVTQTLQAAETIADLLGAETGLQIYAYVAECYGSAVEALASQSADVGWLSPPAYAYASDRYGVEVILTTVRFGQSYYRSQILVRSDSGIDDLSDLAGKNFAYVDPFSASGYLYPSMMISQTQGMSDEDFFSEFYFVGSHPDVVRAVYESDYDGSPVHAGATYEDARASVESEIADVFTQTKVLTYTPNIPNDTVSVRAGMDPSVVQNLVDGLMDLASTPEGKQALDDLYGIEGFSLANDSDYDIIRQYVDYYGVEYETCSQSAPVTEEAGGTVTLTNDDGRETTLEIPPGAVDQPIEISIAQIPLPPDLPADFNFTGDAFELNAFVTGTVPGVGCYSPVDFNTTFTLTVDYDAGGLSTEKEAHLRLYYWQDGIWVEETSSVVDTTINSITATPDHFSIWAVLGRDSFPVYLPLILSLP